MNCCVCYQHADGAKPDHAELLALKLCPGKCFFLLLRDLSDIAILFILLHPVDAADDIPGSQKHPGDHQLFYTVCICPRSIEHYDPFLRAAIKRNVVDTCSCACDYLQIF